MGQEVPDRGAACIQAEGSKLHLRDVKFAFPLHQHHHRCHGSREYSKHMQSVAHSSP